MRLPLAVLVAPPLVLAGAVAVFAGLHAWQGTPRISRTSLPEMAEVRTVDPRFGLEVGMGNASGVSEAGGKTPEAPGLDRELSLTLTGVPEQAGPELIASLIDPTHKTLVASTPIRGGAASTVFEDTPARELFLVVHGEGESPRYQYRDRIVWPADLKTLEVARRLCSVRVEIVGGSPDRSLLLGARRTDDPEWGLPTGTAGLTNAGTAEKPSIVELPLLGPGSYQLCLDGRNEQEIALPGTETIRLTQSD